MKAILLKFVEEMCFTLCSFQYHKGELRLYDVTFENAGMYQCIAENTHGVIYANAELKIDLEIHFFAIHLLICQTCKDRSHLYLEAK